LATNLNVNSKAEQTSENAIRWVEEQLSELEEAENEMDADESDSR
jgi:hypothetical protein